MLVSKAEFERSKIRTQEVVIPCIRSHCSLGSCVFVSAKRDRDEKIDVECWDCSNPITKILLAVRCQGPKYSDRRTHTLRNTEIDHINTPSSVLPDWYVHAYLKTEYDVVAIGLIRGDDMREIVVKHEHRLEWKANDGVARRFAAIHWRDFRHLVEVLERPRIPCAEFLHARFIP